MDITPYVEGFTNRARKWSILCEKSREQALEDVRKIRDFLVEMGPTKIILFGSLAKRESFTPLNDIDLAVEGIAWPTYDPPPGKPTLLRVG